MSQTLATFTATMPATFATFPETFPATLAESHARRSSHRRPPRPHRRSRAQPPTRPQGNKDGGKLAAHRASGKPQHREQRHAAAHEQGPQAKRSCDGIGIAPNIKTHYTRGKSENCKKGKTPATGVFPWVEGFVLLAISIHGGRIAPHQMQAPLASDKNSLPRCAGNVKHHHDRVPPAGYAAFSISHRSSCVRVLAIMSAICCWVLYRTAIPTFVTTSSW